MTNQPAPDQNNDLSLSHFQGLAASLPFSQFNTTKGSESITNLTQTHQARTITLKYIVSKDSALDKDPSHLI